MRTINLTMKFTPNENVLRVALVVFSILFGILSISLIALGAVYTDELWWPKKYVSLDFIELPTLLIILGGVSLAMAVAGCFCAKTYNRIFLLTFAAVLLTILCLELSVAVIAFINFEEHEGGHTKTHQLMLDQYNSVDDDTRLFFQELEDHYSCCGVTGTEKNCTFNNSTDYEYGIWPNNTASDPYADLSLVQGCAEAVNDHIQLIAAEIGYFAAVLTLLQVIQIGYVFLIQKSVKDFYA